MSHTSDEKNITKSGLDKSEFSELDQNSKREKLDSDEDRNGDEYNSGRWKPEEHERFIQAILQYGNEWKSVQKHVVTRSSSQTRSHAQKFFVKIKKTNLLDFNIDLNKNSIKNLHEVANQMNGDQYLNTIKTLNNIAFEKSSNRKKKNDFDINEYSNINKPNNIKIMTIGKVEEKRSNSGVSPIADKILRKRQRGNSMDIMFNNIFESRDEEFKTFFNSYKNEKYDEEENLYESFLKLPNQKNLDNE
jgi:SHAQKYF class myb-like DNA-binding protein